jgi:RNA ligase (TIGR02306 family)
MRKLASIQKIREIRPIKGADMIELAIVNNWQAVVSKAEGHRAGDLVVYCEIDSLLPEVPEFEFLRKGCYKQLPDGTAGFRLRTIRLRGELSQGLIIPLAAAEKIAERNGIQLSLEVGTDVTDSLGIIKWDPPLPANLAGVALGLFPSFIQKTDEDRCQGLTDDWHELKLHTYYVTEKLDGSSTTYFINEGVFGVCSRNLNLAETPDSTQWRIARELNLEDRMRILGRNFALQGELIGPGVQCNSYRLNKQEVRFFNVFDIQEHRKASLSEFLEVIEELNKTGPKLLTVPLFKINYKLPDSIEELLSEAEGHSTLCESAEMEGLVLRTLDSRVSFKAISNRFLLSGGE